MQNVAPRRSSYLDLQQKKIAGEKWLMLTAYDYLMAGVFDEVGVPALLVGDTSSEVVYGNNTTIPVRLDELIPLVRAVVRGAPRTMVVADLPFGSYELSPKKALKSAIRYLKEGGAQAVKLEGGENIVEHVHALVNAGIPTMGHVGLRPQSIYALGGLKVQGRGEGGDKILQEAILLQEAGAFAVVLECIPKQLAQKITSQLKIPTIGIGAGPDCDAQVLVWQDLLGLTPGKLPKYVRKYADFRGDASRAVCALLKDVQNGDFPSSETSYSDS